MIYRYAQLLEKLDLPYLGDLEIQFENKKVFLPSAYCYPRLGVIRVVGTRAALERYGLAELLAHELAEYINYHDGGGSGHSEEFRKIEQDLREEIEHLIREEHAGPLKGGRKKKKK